MAEVLLCLHPYIQFAPICFTTVGLKSSSVMHNLSMLKSFIYRNYSRLKKNTMSDFRIMVQLLYD